MALKIRVVSSLSAKKLCRRRRWVLLGFHLWMLRLDKMKQRSGRPLLIMNDVLTFDIRRAMDDPAIESIKNSAPQNFAATTQRFAVDFCIDALVRALLVTKIQ
ncbi:hypothetical protein [Mesorhizobium sp. B1-1-8]|uniref:hypothetical protein n=1 Tax=Mesorhizobium sp. B1-1-8 TaxID=2589976 RepID=UPI001128383E|nr:hypothetical protein [Mesorhizobium sp. B1-1-8]UCI06591.1 hypothetical protein FJ974_22685 [Mesorhizobium sp. B1-1-8]